MDDFNNPDLRRLAGLCGLGRRFVRGEGVWLEDASGRRFLDAYAQFGAVLLGHNAPAGARRRRAPRSTRACPRWSSRTRRSTRRRWGGRWARWCRGGRAAA